MMAVDSLWTQESCADCFLGQGVLQYRVFRVPIYETHLDETYGWIHQAAVDLGVPCPHRFQRILTMRYWGLSFCVRPLILHGHRWPTRAFRINCDPWYDEDVAEIVRGKRRASPQLAEEFHRKVFLERDWSYIDAFRDELLRLAETKKAQPRSEGPPGDP
jgi:hypothetical protein